MVGIFLFANETPLAEAYSVRQSEMGVSMEKQEKIGMISVLHDLFGEVIIPQAVYDERANEKKQLFY